jgi:hypothetical protein
MAAQVFSRNQVFFPVLVTDERREEEYSKGHLPRLLKQQIREKAEDFSAKKFSAHGSNSLLWQSAKVTSQKVSAEEIEQLPEYVSAVVRATSKWIFSVAPRLSYFTQQNIINPPRPLVMDLMDIPRERGITIWS